MRPLYARQDHQIITCVTRTYNTTNARIARRRHRPHASRVLRSTLHNININVNTNSNITCVTHVERGHRARHTETLSLFFPCGFGVLVSPSKYHVSVRVSGFEDEPSEGEAVVRYGSSLGWLDAKP